VGLASYVPPQIDANAYPGTVLRFQRERWRYFRTNNKFARFQRLLHHLGFAG
jgi:hypothetical protein